MKTVFFLAGWAVIEIYALGPVTRTELLKGQLDDVEISAQGKLQLMPGLTPTGWTAVTPFSNQGRHDSWAFAWNDGAGDFLILSGGQSFPDELIRTDNFRSTINANLSTGAWETLAVDIPKAIFNHKGAVYNDLYLFNAGWEADQPQTGSPTGRRVGDNFVFPLLAGGNFAAAITAPALNQARHTHELVSAAGFLYAMSGVEGNDGEFVEQSEFIPASPFITPWTVLGHPLQNFGAITNTINPAGCFNRWRVYYFGGDLYGQYSTPNGVFSQVSLDGALGAWTAVNNMPDSMFDHSASVIGGKIIVIGGRERHQGQSGYDWLDKTYYAPIQADGSLGAWKNGPTLPKQRGDQTAVNFGRTLFVIGGSDDEPDGSGEVWRMETATDGTFPYGGTYCSPPVKIDPPVLSARLHRRGTLNGGTATVQYKLWTGAAWTAWSVASGDTAVDAVSATPFSFLTYAVNLTGNGTATPVVDPLEIDVTNIAAELAGAHPASRFSLWPNPAPRQSIVKAPAGVKRVEIFTMTGRRLRAFDELSFRHALPAGVYTAVLTGGTGVRISRKLVVL